MKHQAFFRILMLVAITMLILGCGGGGETSFSGTSGTGTLNLSLTDASTSDFKAVYVTIQDVQVHGAGGDWQTVSSPNKTYNLLELVNGVRETLAIATLPPGQYTQMRLILKNTPDSGKNILSRPHPYANYLINNSDQSIKLKVPSALKSGIKIVQGFEINENQTTELILDFIAEKSIVRAGNSGKWLLKPTIKILDTRECSIVSGRVTSGDSGVWGIVVSAQIYDPTASEENRVVVEASTITNDKGEYKLFLSPAAYNLVGYKDGFSPSYARISLESGHTTTQDFVLAPIATGTMTGSVVIQGDSDDQYATISVRESVPIDSIPQYIEIKSLNVADEGSEGRFTTILPRGNYNVVVSSYERTTQSLQVTINSGENSDLGQIILSSSQ